MLVTVGVGGSDLSARVFHDALNHPYHNLLSPEERGGAPEVYFTGDTFDPHKLMGLLGMLKARNLLQKTLFNVISKSGTTTETMATLMVIRDALGDVRWQQQVLATTGLTPESVLFRMHEQCSILWWDATSCSRRGWWTVFCFLSSWLILSGNDGWERRNP